MFHPQYLHNVMTDLIYSDLTYKINGILFKVHNQLGRYCNEKQYSDLIEKLLKDLKMLFEREKILPQSFIGEKSGRNKVDFLIENKVILEIKSRRIITKEDYYQVRRYLEALKLKLGIIVNFRNLYLRPKRILNSSIRII